MFNTCLNLFCSLQLIRYTVSPYCCCYRATIFVCYCYCATIFICYCCATIFVCYCYCARICVYCNDFHLLVLCNNHHLLLLSFLFPIVSGLNLLQSLEFDHGNKCYSPWPYYWYYISFSQCNSPAIGLSPSHCYYTTSSYAPYLHEAFSKHLKN